MKNLAELKRHLQVGVKLTNQWNENSPLINREVVKKQSNGVFMSLEDGGHSFLDLSNAKSFEFNSTNTFKLICEVTGDTLSIYNL